MKIKKFRVLHYKSIVDSSDVRLPSDFAVLIGKNESGKTALLESLRDFDRDAHFPETAFPLHSGEKPSVEITFGLTPKELESIMEESQITVSDELWPKILQEGICLTKSSSGEYKIKLDSMDELFPQTSAAPMEQSESQQIREKQQRLDALLNCSIPEIRTDNMEHRQNSLKVLRGFIKSRLNFIAEEDKKVQIVETLHEINRILKITSTAGAQFTSRARFTHAVVQHMPRFVFFSDFKDILPFEIPVESSKSNDIVTDFARIADLDLDAFVKTQDVQKRINMLSRSSATVSGDFLKHWGQNNIEIVARPEGNKMLFGIKEIGGTDFFKVEQRSRGFQWFLSFYLRLNRFKDHESTVILIDEPGINLHPVAQKDILKILYAKSSGNAQIVFSTHSPTLIDPQRLDRLRFVIKTKDIGTTVKDNVNREVDEESFMPVVIAMSMGSYMPDQADAQDDYTIEQIKEPVKEPVQAPVKAPVEERVEEPAVPLPPESQEVKAVIDIDEKQLEEEFTRAKSEFSKTEEELEEPPKRRSLFGLFRKDR